MTALAARTGGALGVAALAAFTVATAARAQRVDAERARTLVVGTPPGTRAERVDRARSGLAPALPRGGLRVAWKASAGTPVDRPPLVDAQGRPYLVGLRGEVVALAADGTERWRVATNAEQPGPAALLSDDAVVFTDAAGDVVAVRDGRVQWKVRFGRPDGEAIAPLPLDDGGVAVGMARDLAVLDAEGGVRGRVALPVAAGPLLFVRGRVVTTSPSGEVWTWVPGALEPVRAGTFGAALDGGAALAGDHTLVAVTSGGALVAFDLLRGVSSTRAVSSPAAWRGPPAVLRGVACLLSFGPTAQQAVAIDASGREVGRAWLEARSPSASAPDAGPAIEAPGSPPAAPLVDPSGTLAFATPGGSVGVVPGLVSPAAAAAPDNLSVELIRGVCPVPFRASAGAEAVVAGLAPLPEGRLLAVCRSGAVLALTSDTPRSGL